MANEHWEDWLGEAVVLYRPGDRYYHFGLLEAWGEDWVVLRRDTRRAFFHVRL